MQDLAFTAISIKLPRHLSGDENFVLKIETDGHDRPDWMTQVDFAHAVSSRS